MCRIAPAARSGARKWRDVPAARSGARTSSSACLSREAARESDAKRPPCETVRTSGPACPPRETVHGRAVRHACRAKRRAGETRCARCASGARERLDTPAARSGARKRRDVPAARSGTRERRDVPAARSGARTSSSACPPCEPVRAQGQMHSLVRTGANNPPCKQAAGESRWIRRRLSVCPGKTSPDRAQSRLSTGVRSRNSREMLHRAAMPMTA